MQIYFSTCQIIPLRNPNWAAFIASGSFRCELQNVFGSTIKICMSEQPHYSLSVEQLRALSGDDLISCSAPRRLQFSQSKKRILRFSILIITMMKYFPFFGGAQNGLRILKEVNFDMSPGHCYTHWRKFCCVVVSADEPQKLWSNTYGVSSKPKHRHVQPVSALTTLPFPFTLSFPTLSQTIAVLCACRSRCPEGLLWHPVLGSEDKV